jgi:hypothetical protein
MENPRNLVGLRAVCYISLPHDPALSAPEPFQGATTDNFIAMHRSQFPPSPRFYVTLAWSVQIWICHKIFMKSQWDYIPKLLTHILLTLDSRANDKKHMSSNMTSQES